VWHTIWQDLVVPGVPIAEKVIRTLGVYFFLLVGLRLAGKRELTQLNPFDLIVLLVLSNTVQNAIIGNDNSLLGGLFGAAVLLVLNYVVVRFLYTHPVIDRFVEGDPTILVRNGHVLDHRLRRELITRSELEQAARKQGIEQLDQVQNCRLETGGALTFTTRQPTPEEQWHTVILKRMDALDTRLEALNERLTTLTKS
jgi:uncharacterized membrane protein YcaP (DUF421 family)